MAAIRLGVFKDWKGQGNEDRNVEMSDSAGSSPHFCCSFYSLFIGLSLFACNDIYARCESFNHCKVILDVYGTHKNSSRIVYV